MSREAGGGRREAESGAERALAAIVLAAGSGTRMKSETPKALHRLGGRSLLSHALAALDDLAAARVAVVVGHGGEAVAAAARAIRPDAAIVEQAERRGTGHATRMAEAALSDFEGDALVLFADTPFIRPETLRAMLARRAAGAAVVALGFEADDPGGYGRLILGAGEALERIVEARDAGPAERAVRLCNSGVVAADRALLFELLAETRADNAQGEHYLTDIVGLARMRGLDAAAVLCDAAETLGVNSRADLAAAEAAFQGRMREAAMAGGATLVAPETVFFSCDTALGRDVLVEPFVVFGPGVSVGEGARVRAHSHLEGARLGPGAEIGPFARLRPGAEIGTGARVGNFVEVKAATFAAGAKANHLAYIGDAAIGEGANLGAGTITCNYDGVLKHRTEIGAEAFIGSNSALVAPVVIGAGAYVGSGSVITEDVAADALALGRARQMNKPGLAAKLRARLAAMKRG